MADDNKTPEEIAAEEKLAAIAKQEADAKVAADAEAAAKRKVEIIDGKVSLSEQDYNNLVGMKDDMLTYKDAKRKAEKELEDIKAAQLKVTEENQVKNKEFEDLYSKEKTEKEALILKIDSDAINNALNLKALESGIKKSEYVKLIDKSKVTMDKESGEIVGIDEVMESFKTAHPDLFGTGEAAPGVDTSAGSRSTGIISDEDLVKLPGAELMKIKKTDPALYARFQKLATHGHILPDRKKEEEEKK